MEKTMKFAQEELKKNQVRYKKNHDKKIKGRLFNGGSKVLVMLTTNNNKLLMQRKGPYQVTQKIGDHDNEIVVGNKEKNYHANILKGNAQNDETENENETEDLKVTGSGQVL